MGALKKFEGFYKEDVKETSDKKLVTAYQKKICDLLEENPEAQKKAAEILSTMINKK